MINHNISLCSLLPPWQTSVRHPKLSSKRHWSLFAKGKGWIEKEKLWEAVGLSPNRFNFRIIQVYNSDNLQILAEWIILNGKTCCWVSHFAISKQLCINKEGYVSQTPYSKSPSTSSNDPTPRKHMQTKSNNQILNFKQPEGHATSVSLRNIPSQAHFSDTAAVPCLWQRGKNRLSNLSTWKPGCAPPDLAILGMASWLALVTSTNLMCFHR